MMIGDPQNPEDLTRMAAMPSVIRMAMGDPHAARTVPLGPAPEPITMAAGGSPVPDIPQMAPQKVNSPASLPGIMARSQDRLMADYQKDDDPWGSPDNHPGFMGKLGHFGSVLQSHLLHANNELTPREAEEQKLTKSVEDQAGLQSKLGQEEAQTRNLNTTADLAPGKAESEEGLQGAQTKEAGARATSLENPPEEWKSIPTVTGPNGEPVEIESKSGKIRFGDVSGAQPAKQPKPDSPEQQYIDEYQHMHKGSTVADAERQYTLDTQRPPQIAPVMMFAPNPDGGATATVVRPGQTIAPGTQTAAGVNSAATPTAQMRNTAQRAELVHEMVPEVLQNIDQNATALGPLMGRWNDFMQGKVGTDNPQFAQLRADLLLLSSSVALAHAQGRLPENLREEFDRMINNPKQTPANLKAVIQEIDKAMVLNKQVMDGRGQGPGGGSGPTRPANVPEGYVLKDGPKGKGWYKPGA